MSAASVTHQASCESVRQRIFILGSCVSRDAFAFVESDYELVKYVARTSMACAFDSRHASANVWNSINLITSRWQKDVVAIELGRRLQYYLQNTNYDFMVVDLIDERFGIGLIDGARITLSPELMNAGIADRIERKFNPGSAQRWAWWKEGVHRLADIVDASKVIVNEAYWAVQTADGGLLEDQQRIHKNNAQLHRMYAYLKQTFGYRSIQYPAPLLKADPAHKWGLSPFHYTLSVYQHMMDSLNMMSACGSPFRSTGSN